jgi:hypothetical protein
MLKDAIKKLPYIRRLHAEIGQLKEALETWRTWLPPGHFYSPIPSLAEVEADHNRIFTTDCGNVPGVKLNERGQIALLHELCAYYSELPFSAKPSDSNRYYYENEYYSYSDAIFLYSMLRHLRPVRIIEIGSGFSSALILDTKQLFLDGNLKCTFIDPDVSRINDLLSPADKESCQILQDRIQYIPLSVFAELEAGDILFIDSSHVSKTGSDLNHILFNIVPSLPVGVHIHFHDVFYPFEYPEKWVSAGVAWNEAYALRSFLQYNHAFEIELFTSYLVKCHRDLLNESCPLTLESERELPTLQDAPGGSIWLKRSR